MKSKTVMDARCKDQKFRPTAKKALETNLAGALRRLEAAQKDVEAVEKKLSFEKSFVVKNAKNGAFGRWSPAVLAFQTVLQRKQQVAARFEHQVKVLEKALENYA